MMKNIFNSIKEKISKHKKVSILVLLLFLLIGGSIGYVLVTNSATNSNPKVTQTNNQNKNPDTNATGSKDDKKNDDKKSDEKKTDTKPEATVAPSNDVAVEETKNTTTNNVSNNTSSNTVSQPTTTPCIPTYTTINHPEQGHYDTHVVQEAWDDPQFDTALVGLTSGHIYSSVDDFIENSDLYGDGNYASKTIQVGTVHHDAVTTQVWVVDQAAWTETVASGC
jgi:hypothetical protein